MEAREHCQSTGLIATVNRTQRQTAQVPMTAQASWFKSIAQHRDMLARNEAKTSHFVRLLLIQPFAALQRSVDLTLSILQLCKHSYPPPQDSAAAAQHQTASVLRPQIFCVIGVIEVESAPQVI